MAWLRAGAIGAGLLAASYAWAAPPEGYLGRGVPADGGKVVTPPGAAALGLGEAAGSDASPVRYGRALAGLKPQEGAATRGAADTRIYQAASSAVVLIVTDEALGSGVLISPDGRIVTNLHVVGDHDEVGVIFKPAVEGASVEKADVHRAKVLRRDEVADLALIQVSEVPSHVKPLAIAGSSALQVGADVHAIGHPTGEAWTYTRGIVSQIRRDYDWAAEDRIKHHATVIQTQTPINPGNSGGPLIDDNLQVVGINSFKGDGEGLNFAVSAEDVNAFLARTGDRLSEHPRKVDAKNCKPVALKQRATAEDDGVEYAMDGDCDGTADYVLIVPDDKREAIVVMYDDDGDGKLDSAEFDENRDGKPDHSLYDTDADGKFDLEGRYRRGETEPYRYDRIKDS
jgi:S1-C subfamily serine protease